MSSAPSRCWRQPRARPIRPPTSTTTETPRPGENRATSSSQSAAGGPNADDNASTTNAPRATNGVVQQTATAAARTQADARCFGSAVGVGVVGGLVAGAIIGSAVANSRPAYVVAPGPGYVAYPAYAAALPGPNCYWTRMPVYDAFGNVVGWRGRPVAVCQ